MAKKKKYHLEHLDDARDRWEAVGKAGEALSKDHSEEESTLESLASIADAAAMIKESKERLNKNRKKIDLEGFTENGVDIGAYYIDSYRDIDLNIGNFNTDNRDTSWFNNEQLSTLDFSDPKQSLLGRDFISNKNILDQGDYTYFKDILQQPTNPTKVQSLNQNPFEIKSISKKFEQSKSQTDQSSQFSYDGPGSPDFEAEREFRTGEKPKTEHKIETWRDLEDEPLPKLESSPDPLESVKVEIPHGLTETEIVPNESRGFMSKIQDILNNRKR